MMSFYPVGGFPCGLLEGGLEIGWVGDGAVGCVWSE